MGRGRPFWLKWWPIAWRVERNIFLDWAPVSTMALTGRLSIDTSRSKVGPTAGTSSSSALTVLVALPISRAYSWLSLWLASICSSYTVQSNHPPSDWGGLHRSSTGNLGTARGFSFLGAITLDMASLPTPTETPHCCFFLAPPFCGCSCLTDSPFADDVAALRVWLLLLLDWSEWAAALAAYCFSYCSIIRAQLYSSWKVSPAA